MHFQYTPFILPLLAAGLVSAWVATTILLRRSETNLGLAGLAVAIVVWSLGYALEIAGADLATKIFWGQIQYFAIAGIPFAWLVFCYNHTHPGAQLSRRTLLLLAIVPLITIGLVLTNGWHGLVWRETHITQACGFTVLGVSYGPWFWIHSVYSYALNLVGSIIIFRFLSAKRGLYRGQSITLIIGVIVPWVGNFLYLAGLSPIAHLDLTPFAFTVTVIAITWGIYGFRLISLTPLARDFVVEAMSDGMIVIDAQSRVSDVNAAALKLLGLSYKDSVGVEAGKVFRRWPLFLDCIGKQVEALDEFTLGKDSEERRFEIHTSPLFDRSKHVLGWVITFREITERKRADEQVRQLSRAVEASPVSIVITDTRANIKYVNPKFCEVTGYSQAEVLGQNPRILKTDQTPPEVHRQLWETITAGRVWQGDLANRKKNGEIFWESASISPIPDAAGEIAFYVAVKEDVTERRKLGEGFAVVRDQALEASRMKSQMLADVSASLRAPIRAILRSAEQLQVSSLGASGGEHRRILNQVIDRSLYLDSLAEELSDELQLEAKTLGLHLVLFSPAALLKEMGSRMSTLANSRSLSFSTNISAGTPDPVQGDNRRLQQVFTNLAAYAIQNSPGGNVSMRIFPSAGDQWGVQIKDSSDGIPAQELETIFEPFHRGRNSAADGGLCTGLGLAIASQLVTLMGGKITVESHIGKGSTFTVILPVAANEKIGI